MLTNPLSPLLLVLLAGWLPVGVAGCAVLPVAVMRPLPSTSVALAGLEETRRSLTDAWAYSEKNFAAVANNEPVAAYGATHAAYQRWVNDEVRELPDPSETIAIGGSD